jgi:hypothetical protein
MSETRVEVAETSWKSGLPDERSRRLLLLLFGSQTDERGDPESGEADKKEHAA